MEDDLAALDRVMRGDAGALPGASQPASTQPAVAAAASMSELLSAAKWPSADAYDRTLGEALAGAASAPCSAPLLGRARLSPYGFGAHLNQFANEVVLAMYSGKPIALCAPPDVRDQWAKYFQDPGFARCESCDWATGPRQYREMGMDISDSPDHTKMVDVKRFVYGKLFALQSDAQSRIGDAVSSLGLSGTYVGVHVRRGDKAREVPLVPMERYAAAVAQMCSRVGTKEVFLASDDGAAHAELQRSLGSEYTIVEQKRLLPDVYQLRGDAARSMSPPFGEEDEERSVLVDVAALVGAIGFVGTASSNIGRLVFFQRAPGSLATSLDEGGNSGFVTLS